MIKTGYRALDELTGGGLPAGSLATVDDWGSTLKDFLLSAGENMAAAGYPVLCVYPRESAANFAFACMLNRAYWETAGPVWDRLRDFDKSLFTGEAIRTDPETKARILKALETEPPAEYNEVSFLLGHVPPETVAAMESRQRERTGGRLSFGHMNGGEDPGRLERALEDHKSQDGRPPVLIFVPDGPDGLPPYLDVLRRFAGSGGLAIAGYCADMSEEAEAAAGAVRAAADFDISLKELLRDNGRDYADVAGQVRKAAGQQVPEGEGGFYLRYYSGRSQIIE